MRAAAALLAVALCACSPAPAEADPATDAGRQEAGAQVLTLDAETLAARAQAGEVVLVDVRTPEEFASGHLPGAVNMPIETFDPAAVPQEEGRETILYCRSGNRSGRGAEQLAAYLDAPVRHLEGGIVAWEGAGLETVTP